MATKDNGTVSTGEAPQTAARRRGPSHNQVSLIGRLTRDPELRFTADGVPVTRFTIANNGTDGVQFHPIVAWRRLAEVSTEYLDKGSLVFVSGRLKGRNWTGKDGLARHQVDIVASEIQFLSPRRTATEAAA